LESITETISLQKAIKSLTKFRIDVFPWKPNFHFSKKRQGRIWSIKRFYTSQGLRDIKTALNSSKKIQQIHFSLNQYGQGDVPNLHHVNIFTKLTILKSIDFDFFICSAISDKNLSNVSRCLKRLRFLKKIRLDFFCLSQTHRYWTSNCLQMLQRMWFVTENLSYFPMLLSSDGHRALLSE